MSQQIQQKYRMLAQLVKRLPRKSQDSAWQELRTEFRVPLGDDESVDQRLRKADERVSILRMMTPKDRTVNQGGRWIYRNGEIVEGQATRRDGSGRVVSNWDGNNLDPDSVKRHKQQLNRAGFVNNAHAKGIF